MLNNPLLAAIGGIVAVMGAITTLYTISHGINLAWWQPDGNDMILMGLIALGVGAWKRD
jgi:hypothetical protein